MRRTPQGRWGEIRWINGRTVIPESMGSIWYDAVILHIIMVYWDWWCRWQPRSTTVNPRLVKPIISTVSREDDVALWINEIFGTLFSEKNMEIPVHPCVRTALSCELIVSIRLARPIPMVSTQQRTVAGLHSFAIVAASRPPLHRFLSGLTTWGVVLTETTSKWEVTRDIIVRPIHIYRLIIDKRVHKSLINERNQTEQNDHIRQQFKLGKVGDQ